MRTEPQFNDLLIEAESALNEIDSFDLDSNNQEAFKVLDQTYRTNAKALVNYILANGTALLAELS